MESDNDNFSNEADFLLTKAHDILKKYSPILHHSTECIIMHGGICPVLSSALASLRIIAK